MKFNIFLFVALLIFFLIPYCSAAHYVVGIVNDAKDGTIANDHRVVLWNPINGIQDNLTDTIGVNGDSSTNKTYMIDCEMLLTPCQIDDELNVMVYDIGDGYVSEKISLIVTDGGFDIANNITLNSFPDSFLKSPVNFANLSLINITFNCSAGDLDSNLANISLYGNWSFGWHLNETLAVFGSNSSVLFTKSLPEGHYEWNCKAQDNLSASSFYANNLSLNVDRTNPFVNSVLVNETHTCGDSTFVRVTCNTNDSTGIENVIIEAINSSGNKNFTADFFAENDYYVDLLINQIGSWNFNCYSFDKANNSLNLTSPDFFSYTNLSDLKFLNLSFSNLDPFEGESVILNATIKNNGCSNADNFLVGFYNNNPLFGGQQIGLNQTISLSGLSTSFVNVSWGAIIGTSNLFVSSDLNNLILESDENNNFINQTIYVGAWQEFYGNVSAVKILSDFLLKNVSSWGNEINLNGNVFMTDKESEIDWLSLLAIGRNLTGGNSIDDFSEIDDILGMQDFEDSIYSVFTDGGSPKETDNLLIHNKVILNVPIINSTNNENFKTGILWDSSDDLGDNEYNFADKEDLVFVASINKGSVGEYGIYDYEIKVPVELRDYDSTDSETIYLYYDLV